MKVSVETTSNLGRKLTVAIPFADVDAKKQEKIKKVASTAKLDGFRKGKVPANFIKQKYSKQIHGEAISELIGASLQDALKQENLAPAETPIVEDITDQHGKDLQYIAKFEVVPEIELVDFSKVELEKPVADITEEDIEQGIKSLQEQFATWTVVDKKAEHGDKLVIDFAGTIDGKPFQSGDGKNIALEIGSQRFIPGFEDGLLGVKAGDSSELNVTFPEDYNVAELAGKPAKFDVTVHSVAGKELAQVDEEFAKKIGLADGDVAKIKDKIKTNMKEFLENIVKEELRKQAVEKLLEVNQFDVPDSLVTKETKAILAKNKTNTNQEQEMQGAQKDAHKRIKLGFLLNKIIAKYNLQVEENRIRNKIAELSAMLGGNSEIIERIYKGSEELLANIKSSALTEQAIDLVVEYATIKNKNSTFYDIANRST